MLNVNWLAIFTHSLKLFSIPPDYWSAILASALIFSSCPSISGCHYWASTVLRSSRYRIFISIVLCVSNTSSGSEEKAQSGNSSCNLDILESLFFSFFPDLKSAFPPFFPFHTKNKSLWTWTGILIKCQKQTDFQLDFVVNLCVDVIFFYTC